MNHTSAVNEQPQRSRNPRNRSKPRPNSRASKKSQYGRIPYLGWLPDKARNHFIAMAGEFAGTFLFLFFAFSGTQVANTQTEGVGSTTISQAPNPAQLLYISLCFGFSLAVNVWVFFRISGGLFNPAVAFGMALVGALPVVRGILLVVSQILAGIAAAAVVSCLFPGPLNVQTSLGGGCSIVQALFIEMFLTTELVFTIFMLAAEKHKGTFIAPVGIGLSLFIAELTGVYYTGGSLNPARSFGPSVVLHQFFHYHWIYWVGPLLGTLLASGFYKFIKMLEYETANPGQDLDDKEAQVFDPERDVTRPNVVLREGEWATEPISPSDEPASRFANLQGEGGTEYGQEGYQMSEQPGRHSTGSGHRRSGSRRGPVYPTAEGTANYPTAPPQRASLNTYRAGPDAEAGGYASRSSRHP